MLYCNKNTIQLFTGLQNSKLWIIKSNKANVPVLAGHHTLTSSVSYEHWHQVLPKTDQVPYLFCQDLSAAVYDVVSIYNICWKHPFLLYLLPKQVS
jgi:hypothetical protein